MKARACQRPRQPDVDEPGLDDRVAIADADFEDPLHPRQADHHAAANGQRAAGQARAGPPRHERNVMPIADLHDLDDVLGRGREDDHVGNALLDDVAVALVDQHLVLAMQDVVGTERCGQLGQDARRDF